MHKLDDDNNVSRLHMIVPDKLLTKVDDWRAKQPGVPSRSKAIRQLIERGLKVK